MGRDESGGYYHYSRQAALYTSSRFAIAEKLTVQSNPIQSNPIHSFEFPALHKIRSRIYLRVYISDNIGVAEEVGAALGGFDCAFTFESSSPPKLMLDFSPGGACRRVDGLTNK